MRYLRLAYVVELHNLVSMANLYIERHLHAGGDPVSERDAFPAGEVTIVLAEPGAGKSELLGSAANRLATKPIRASIFRHSTAHSASPVLIVDALDEVARQDETALDQVIVKASESGARTVVLSARSDVWPNTRTRFVKDCFGKDPQVLFLKPFNEDEQRQLFEAQFPSEQFVPFLKAVSAVGLEPLLGNPMFLTLFVEGYLQLGRTFTSKAEVFHQAVARLAGGDGKEPLAGAGPSTKQVVQKSTELFAKLLLAGASGISTTECLDKTDFPYLLDFSTEDTALVTAVINTRLFLPTDKPDQHTPVHRIVAEYCAAKYLSARIDKASDRLSLKRCLAVVAPNGVIRDDLRGLAGWMAALGSKDIQEAIVDLDAYAVLANGDPGQLLPSSRARLIFRLRAIAESDPYFRRLDGWRRFNAAGFFDEETVPLVKSLLLTTGTESHLQQLVLELLHESNINADLIEELRAILLDAQSDWWSREHARQLLVSVPSYDHEQDVENLVALESPDSFRLVSRFQTHQPIRQLRREIILKLLQFAGSENFTPKSDRGQRVDLKLSLKALIETFSATDAEHYLDRLTEALNCTCAPARPNMCSCKRRRSKVIGSLLDRLFETSNCAPEKVWAWVKNVRFYSHGGAPDTSAVKALRENVGLRRSIQCMAFSGLKDSEAIWDMIVLLRWGNLHAGLAFDSSDTEFHANKAFAENNIALWSQFIWRHDPYSKRTEPDPLIQLWKRHARIKPDCMKVWSKLNRDWRNSFREERKTYGGRRRWSRRDEDTKAQNLAALQENRSVIETGRRWWWTDHFSYYFLYFPEKIGELDDGKGSAERTLYNCFEPLLEHLPSLPELAAGEKQNIARMLHASAIIHFRKHGNLNHWSRESLLVLKTEVSGAKAYADGEAERLEEAVDELIFTSEDDVDRFSRAWFQPRLMAKHDPLWSFRHKECYSGVRGRLASEWLESYPMASVETTGTLFAICAQEGDRRRLLDVIELRSQEMLHATSTVSNSENDERQKFWFTCHFFFVDQDPSGIWPILLALPDAVFLLERKVGRWDRAESQGWPKLGARKIFLAMDALVPKWPKVFLPDSFGTGDPPGESAYRFLCDLVWKIAVDTPQNSIAVIDQMLLNPTYSDFAAPLKSMRAAAVSKMALQDFKVPRLSNLVAMLDSSQIVTVEDMRAMLLEELAQMQTWLCGSETNPRAVFWPGGERVDENSARNRVVDWLAPRLKAQDAAIVVEHHMADNKRCDFTVSRQLDGKRLLLVCEAKGQWHPEIFSAAQTQLERRYAIHPDAAKQGVYLAFWFGPQIEVAGKIKHGISSAENLKEKIRAEMPNQLTGLIDVFVLDLSQV